MHSHHEYIQHGDGNKSGDENICSYHPYHPHDSATWSHENEKKHEEQGGVIDNSRVNQCHQHDHDDPVTWIRENGEKFEHKTDSIDRSTGIGNNSDDDRDGNIANTDGPLLEAV